MIRRIALGATGVAAIAVAAAVLNGAHLPILRTISLFRVTEVEVIGAWLLAPHEAYDGLALGPEAHLWDDHEDALARMRRHPAVLDVRLQRRLPGTLVVEVEERIPVALLDEGGLVPVTADGVRIPIDPARAALDLPLIRGSDDPARLGRLLGSVAAATAAGIEVSEVLPSPEGVRLLLADGFEVHMSDYDPWTLAKLAGVVESLRRGDAMDGVDPSRVEIDLRFSGQAIVRPLEPESSRSRPSAAGILIMEEGRTHGQRGADA